MFKIKSIQKNFFINSSLPILFNGEEYTRSYYEIIKNNISVLKFSAQSEIEPTLIYFNGIVVIGIDQIVVGFSADNCKIITELMLSSFFYEFILLREYLCIVCETEIILLSRLNLVEHKIFSFVDYISNVKEYETFLSIHFLEGGTETLEIE